MVIKKLYAWFLFVEAKDINLLLTIEMEKKLEQ
jgi:hypothetical protein